MTKKFTQHYKKKIQFVNNYLILLLNIIINLEIFQFNFLPGMNLKLNLVRINMTRKINIEIFRFNFL